MGRTVFLDFDGGCRVYRNPVLDLNIPLSQSPSGVSFRRRAALVERLNRAFPGGGVRFTTDAAAAVSAVHIGRSNSFDAFGNFAGLAEGIGSGDAFVFLDDSAADGELIDVILHEAGHILGILDHGGEGAARYAYNISYTLHPKNYQYGYSETIRNGNVTNNTDISKFTHNLTYSILDPETGLFITVKSYQFSAGASDETVSYPQPSVQSILGALDISFNSDRDVLYKDLYGQQFTIRRNFYAKQGRTRISADYHCDDTLTVVPVGTLLLDAPALAGGSGSTDYRDAAVRADQKTLAGITVGDGGAGNLVVNSEGDGKYGELVASTITRNGRVEFDRGQITSCTVAAGGVVSLRDVSSAKDTRIDKDGALYYDGGESTALLSTSVNWGGELYVLGGNVKDVTVYGQGGALFNTGVSLNGSIRVENGGRIWLMGQLKKDDRYSCELTLDVSDGESAPQAMVSGLQYLPLGSTVTINVSAGQKEGSYLLAEGVVDADALPGRIGFTVDGREPMADYSGQYTFVWDDELSRYSSVDYNGLKYSLNLNGSGYLSLSVTDEIPDWVLEKLSRNMGAPYSVYRDHYIGEKLEVQSGQTKYYFRVAEVFSDDSGFFAMGLRQMDENGKGLDNSLLICRGTEANLKDITADLNPIGIGYMQHISGEGKRATDWLFSQQKEGRDLYLSGHSLGGALAQYFATDLGNVEKLVTFNSPGITASWFVDGTVHHYVVDGDLVSMAGAGYVYSDDSQLFFTTDHTSRYDSLGKYLDDRHTAVWTCRENGGGYDRVFPVSHLSDKQFSYLTADSFNVNYADLVLTLCIGSSYDNEANADEEIPEDLGESNRMTTRGGVENFRENATYLEMAGLLYSGATTEKRYCRVFAPALTSSVGGNTHTVKAVDIDDDDIPEVLYDFTDLKFLPIKVVYLQDSLLFKGGDFDANVQTVKLEKNDGQWIMITIPAVAEKFYELSSVMNAVGTKLSASNVFRQNGRYYVLDDPDTTYSFSFTRKTEVVQTTASLALSADILTKDSQTLTVTLGDIDASVSAGSGNDTAQISAALYRGGSFERSIILSAGETKMEGVFQATLSLNDLNIAPDCRLVFSYSDFCDDSGNFTVVTREISAEPEIRTAYIDETGLAGDGVPFVGDAAWQVFAVAFDADSLVGRYTIAWDVGSYAEKVLLFDAGSGGSAKVALGRYFSASGKSCKVDNVNGDLVVTVEDAAYKQQFDLHVSGKQAKNFFAAGIAPGEYTITGDFAPGLNATVTVTDLITGKKVGSLTVKNGAIARQSTFLLDGDYLFSIAGDGRSSGDCSITLTGKVNDGVDHSDDTFDLAYCREGTNFVSGSVGFGDAVDWIRTDITDAGRYSIDVSGIDPSAKVTVTLWSSLYGGAPKKVSSKSASGKDLRLEDLLLSAEDGLEYFVSVSCDNAAKGAFTGYTMAVSGAVYDSLHSDRSDDVLTGDLKPLALRTGTAVDAATGTLLEIAATKGWVGYGDPADVIPFSVTSPGEWNISLQADAAKSVSLTLQSVSVDPDTGEYRYASVASGKADANGRVGFSGMLQSGLFVLTVTAADQKTDKSNTAYSLTLEETGKYAAINASSGDCFSMSKGETKTFTLTSVQKISLDKISNLSLWTGNGKNGKSTIKLTYDKTTKTYDAVLAPGTYFLTASNRIYDVSISGTYPDGFGSSMFTADNGFAEAGYFYTYTDAGRSCGYASSFVGYGDGVDFYGFTVGDGDFAPGDYTLSLGRAVSNCVSVTAYMKVVSGGKTTYKQIGKFTHKTGEETSITLGGLFDGEYFVKVESLSYANAANAKGTTYNLTLTEKNAFTVLTPGIPLDSAACVLAKGQYACYRGTGDGSGFRLYHIDARVANGYEVYVNNGDGKLTKVKVSGGSFILEDDRLFYVKSTKDHKDYSQGISLTEEALPSAYRWFDQYFSMPDGDNLSHLEYEYSGDYFDGWYGWIGYGNPAQVLGFGTGLMGGIDAGWASFEISDIVKSLDDQVTTKFTLTLEKWENGDWKKVTSSSGQSAYDKKSGTYQFTGGTLNAALADDTDYRLVVATSDKGAGLCSGIFAVDGTIDRFDHTDDSLAAPRILTADTEGTVVRKFDDADVYELDDLSGFYLDMDSGSAKLTFYDEDYNAVSLNGKHFANVAGQRSGSIARGTTMTLNAGNAKTDGIMLSASELLDYDIRFVRIEAAGNANNHYRIAVGGTGLD